MFQTQTEQKTTSKIPQINNIDITQVAGNFGIELHNKSYGYEALCPFHQEKTPSFQLIASTNSWRCFGCPPNKNGRRNGGDVYEFLRLQLGSYGEVIRWVELNFPDFKSVESVPLPKITIENKGSKITPGAVEYWAKNLWLSNQQGFFLNRGFSEESVSGFGFGFDGESHIIPIWDGKPFASEAYSVKKRPLVPNGPKYIKDGEYDKSPLWGKHYNNYDVAFLFAGELDAALAVQNGLPALSVVDGQGTSLPFDWPERYFKYQTHLVVVFDKNEKVPASILANTWNTYKGFGTGVSLCWPLFDGDDYNDFILQYSHDEFMTFIRGMVPHIDKLLQEDF